MRAVTFIFRLNANLLAFFLGLESVLVTLAASVPESRATAVIGVVEPLDGKVTAGTSVLPQATRRARHHRHGEATLEILALSFLDSIGAASELRRVAGASGKVRSLGRRPAVRAALVLGVLASAAC